MYRNLVTPVNVNTMSYYKLTTIRSTSMKKSVGGAEEKQGRRRGSGWGFEAREICWDTYKKPFLQIIVNCINCKHVERQRNRKNMTWNILSLYSLLEFSL